MSPAPVSVTDSSGGVLATGGYEASPATSIGVGAGVGAARPGLVTRTTATSATAATARSAASAARKRLRPAGTPGCA